MPKDVLSAVTLISSFALWGACHILLSLSLSRRAPRWRGPVALFILPLAPYWGARTGSRALATIWCCALSTWIVGRLLLSR